MLVALLGTFPVRSYFEGQLKFTTSVSLEHPSSPLVNLAHQLAQDNEMDVHVVTLHPHLKQDCVLEKDRVTFHLLHGGRLSLQILTLYQLDKFRILSTLNLIQPDIVQAFGTEGPYALAASESPCPSIVYIQGVISELIKSTPVSFNLNWLRMFLTQFVERRVVRKVKDFIAESSFSAAFVHRINPSANVHLMKNLISPKYFQIERKPDPMLHLILFVGRITASKGVFELLRAFSEIHQGYMDIRLEFIGPLHDPAEEIKIKALVHDLKLSDCVSFAGLKPAEYIAERLAVAQMMVYPSYLDTSPNSIYEAMAAGVPVVATEAGGIPEMVKHSFNGILAPVRNHIALAEAMQFLLDHPEENRRIGENAKSTAQKELDPARFVGELKKIYNLLLPESIFHLQKAD